jgi:hypothetical protein
VVVIVLALVLFFYALVFPMLSGTFDARQELSHPARRVTLFFKRNEEDLFGRELRDANSSGKLVLLTQTKDIVVVYVACQPIAHVIPRSNLQEVRIESWPVAGLNGKWRLPFTDQDGKERETVFTFNMKGDTVTGRRSRRGRRSGSKKAELMGTS